MEIKEIEKNGAFLVLEIDGIVRKFFIISETKKYSNFSSSLINAGDCVSFSAKVAEIIDEKYSSYGLDIQTSYEEHEYSKGWSGLDYVVDFREQPKPPKINRSY